MSFDNTFCLIQYISVCVCSVTQLCRTLCNPMDCRPIGSSVHGILQARILEWVAIMSNLSLKTTPTLHPRRRPQVTLGPQAQQSMRH